MNTDTLDAAAMIDKRCNPAKMGQVIGKVGNFEGVRGNDHALALRVTSRFIGSAVRRGSDVIGLPDARQNAR